MTIVRHDNPFPALWADLASWWVERCELRQMPPDERRAWKADRKAALKAEREEFRREWQEEHGTFLQAYSRHISEIWQQAQSNIWGIWRHGTFVRIFLIGTLIALFFKPETLGMFALGIAIHILVYREIADEDGVEARLVRSERTVSALIIILAVMILAFVSPFARNIVLDSYIPLAIGVLAPVSFSRKRDARSGWMSGILVWLFDLAVVVALFIGVMLSPLERQLDVSLKDTNWSLCSPFTWSAGRGPDTSGLIKALDRNSDVGACFGDDGSLAGLTPLHLAAGFGKSPHHLRILVDYGADINAAYGDTTTALHHAAERADNPGPFILMLLDLGADTSIRNSIGQTAADVAMGNKAVPEDVLHRLLVETDTSAVAEITEDSS